MTKSHSKSSDDQRRSTNDVPTKGRPVRKALRSLSNLPDGSFGVVSVDIFDTLLLRKPISERRRQFEIAKRFALLAEGKDRELFVDAATIWRARRQAQQAAYNVRRIVKADGEVRLADILKRMSQMLALPEDFIPLMMQAELDVETRSVVANRRLIGKLRRVRGNGTRLIAISDTPLPASAVQVLVDRIAGPKLFDRIYSSADEDATKRNGTLFQRVLDSEGISASDVCHIGDDLYADEIKASQFGITTLHVPRSPLIKLRRQSDGIIFEVKRSALNVGPFRPRAVGKTPMTAEQYGYEVFGPIVTQACLLLWLHFCELAREEKPIVLFCARGGLRIRYFLSLVTRQLGLLSDICERGFMVSRLVAARAAFAHDSDVAIREIVRLFAGRTARTAAEAFVGRALDLPMSWDREFTYDSFRVLLDTVSGRSLRQQISEKNRLFENYLNDCTDGFGSITLVDTGIHGVTLQLLMDAYPDKDWQMLHLARSRDYRGDSAHFSHLAGLLVERDGYSPLDRNSLILRYWHLLERLFELDLPSVQDFIDENGAIKSNLEISGWQKRVAEADSPFVSGVLKYIGELRVQDIHQQDERADYAWSKLKKNILFPHVSDVDLLDIGTRSWNIGREDFQTVIKSPKQDGLSRRLRDMWASPWSEGYAVRAFPRSYPLVHAGLRAEFWLRELRQAIVRR